MSKRPRNNIVSAPEALAPLFVKAERVVDAFFKQKVESALDGRISLFDSRYLLVRGSTLAFEFYRLIRQYFGEDGQLDADCYSNSVLYDLAFAIAKSDARVFHEKMGLTDPLERLSMGPVIFAYTGWASVTLLESVPSADDEYFIAYEHPNSFESDSWLENNERPPFPICSMSAGYSAGWCSESFDLPLVAKELTCKACGDEQCLFLMAPPHRIKKQIQSYAEKNSLTEVYQNVQKTDSVFQALKDIGQVANLGGIRGKVIQHVMRYARELDLTKQTLTSKLDALEIEIKRRKEVEQALKDMANYDHLTGLFNRRCFNQQLKMLIDSGAGQHALMYIDLDDFKIINDSLGHDVGDDVLVASASKLQQVSNENIILARLGGDEFGLIVKNYLSSSALEALLIDFFKGLSEMSIGKHKFALSASIGIACFPRDADNLSELERKADMAMYEAKKMGKNGFRHYDDVLDIKLQRHLMLSKKLYNAIGNEAIDVVFQPRVSLATGQLSGVEMFARWHDLELGDISPNEFIGIAESYGFSHRLLELMLKKVGRLLPKLVEYCSPSCRVAMNVSPMQLNSKELLSLLEKTHQEQAELLGKITFDVTEQALILDRPHAIRLIEQFKSLGLRVCIDDFGAGFSALSTLHDFVIDEVKLDCGFTEKIHTDDKQKTLVQSIIDIVHVENIGVIAEGVECHQQALALKSMGCDHMQGYLIGHPLAIDELLGLLKRFANDPLYLI